MRLPLLLVAGLILFAQQAGAVEICFEMPVVTIDSGRRLSDMTTEDRWYSDGNQRIRGAKFSLAANGTIYSGNLGDGVVAGKSPGCTGSLPIPVGASVSWSIWTSGTVRSNNLIVRNDDVSPKATISKSGTFTLGSEPVPTVNIAITNKPQRMLQAYTIAAYAMYQSTGGVTGRDWYIDVYNTTGKYPDLTNFHKRSEGAIKLTTDGPRQKFVLAHELGHMLMDFAGAWFGGDCTFESPSCRSAGGEHSMGSMEHQSCAFSEGFAHFYSARVWNSNTQNDCVFANMKSEFGLDNIAVDCESTKSTPCLDESVPAPGTCGANDPYPSRFMEVRCTGVFDNMGAEVDWLRVLWDVYTDGASPPSFPEIVDWLDAAQNIVPPGSQPYDELDWEANAIGGPLNTNWDNAKGPNGVDH